MDGNQMGAGIGGNKGLGGDVQHTGSGLYGGGQPWGSLGAMAQQNAGMGDGLGKSFANGQFGRKPLYNGPNMGAPGGSIPQAPNDFANRFFGGSPQFQNNPMMGGGGGRFFGGPAIRSPAQQQPQYNVQDVSSVLPSRGY